MVSLDDSIKKHRPLAAREVAGEVVIMTGADAKLHALNEVGTFVWGLLDSETQVARIVSAVVENFRVDREAAERDVLKFLDDMIEKDILVAGRQQGGD